MTILLMPQDQTAEIRSDNFRFLEGQFSTGFGGRRNGAYNEWDKPVSGPANIDGREVQLESASYRRSRAFREKSVDRDVVTVDGRTFSVDEEGILRFRDGPQVRELRLQVLVSGSGLDLREGYRLVLNDVTPGDMGAADQRREVWSHVVGAEIIVGAKLAVGADETSRKRVAIAVDMIRAVSGGAVSTLDAMTKIAEKGGRRDNELLAVVKPLEAKGMPMTGSGDRVVFEDTSFTAVDPRVRTDANGRLAQFVDEWRIASAQGREVAMKLLREMSQRPGYDDILPAEGTREVRASRRERYMNVDSEFREKSPEDDIPGQRANRVARQMARTFGFATTIKALEMASK